MSIKRDIDRAVNSFLGQFNMMYSKFYFIDRNMIYYLLVFYLIFLWCRIMVKRTTKTQCTPKSFCGLP